MAVTELGSQSMKLKWAENATQVHSPAKTDCSNRAYACNVFLPAEPRLTTQQIPTQSLHRTVDPMGLGQCQNIWVNKIIWLLCKLFSEDGSLVTEPKTE